MEPRSPDHVALGRSIRAFREERQLSQEALGLESGLDRTFVGGIERGERNLSFGTMLKLASGLRTQPSEILARAEPFS